MDGLGRSIDRKRDRNLVRARNAGPLVTPKWEKEKICVKPSGEENKIAGQSSLFCIG